VYNSVPVTAELLSGVDLVVITTDHSSYDYDLIVERASYVFDTRMLPGRLSTIEKK